MSRTYKRIKNFFLQLTFAFNFRSKLIHLWRFSPDAYLDYGSVPIIPCGSVGVFTIFEDMLLPYNFIVAYFIPSLRVYIDIINPVGRVVLFFESIKRIRTTLVPFAFISACVFTFYTQTIALCVPFLST